MLYAAVGDFIFQIQILTVSEMYALTLTIKQVGPVRKQQKLLNACHYTFLDCHLDLNHTHKFE